MIFAEGLIALLRRAGFEVSIDAGNQLWVKPRHKLTPDQLELLRSRKTELIHVLQDEHWKHCTECRAEVDATARSMIRQVCFFSTCPHQDHVLNKQELTYGDHSQAK